MSDTNGTLPPGGIDRLARVEILIPTQAFEECRKAAARAFDQETATDVEVFHWMWLNLGVDVFGPGVKGSGKLAELGVVFEGWADSVPDYFMSSKAVGGGATAPTAPKGT